MADKNVKKRHWAMVVYPESLPEDWIDRLERTGLPMAISPIHDRDENATHEHKKDHYHVLMTYQGPTAYSVVKRITDDLGQPHPQPVEQIRGYYRYLTHEDNPEKRSQTTYGRTVSLSMLISSLFRGLMMLRQIGMMCFLPILSISRRCCGPGGISGRGGSERSSS